MSCYFEGGITGGHDDWRVPRTLLERSVRAGAIVVVADATFNELNTEREEYLAASTFLGATPNYGVEGSAPASFGPSPVYGVDRRTGERKFDVSPAATVVAEWLRPVYADVDRILVLSPIEILPVQDVLASGDPTHTATLQRDLFVDEFAYCSFASVRQLGDGYVVFIAAAISADSIVEAAPDNARWIHNTVQLLRREIARDSQRYAGIRRLHKVFTDVIERSGEADRELKVTQALDRETEQALRRENVQAASQALSEIFGPLWTSISEKARHALVAAEIHRHDAELLADTEVQLDFAAAVGAYSRAVEIELLQRLFEPYREWPGADQLPEPREEKRDGASLRVLSKHVAGKDPTLGEMAFLLLNVGCRLRDAEPNAFAAYLRSRLVDLDAFCEARFPQQLLDYTQQFRNRAMHAGDLTAGDCKAARDYLFEEPVRLMVYLGEVLLAPTNELGTA